MLNLADVNYIDSSGIGELVSAFTTTKNQGGELKLLNLKDPRQTPNGKAYTTTANGQRLESKTLHKPSLLLDQHLRCMFHAENERPEAPGHRIVSQ